MRTFLTLGLMLSATGCAVTPTLTALAPRPAAVTTAKAKPKAPVFAQTGPISGAYLAIEMRQSNPLLNLARELRGQLKFLDLSQAIPPRKQDALHVTVAYFRSLSPHSGQKLFETWHGNQPKVTVTGWGVVQDKAAYFTVSGLEDWTPRLRALKTDPFTADDPHMTFGVHPSTRRDVHGVPKQPQHSVAPISLIGDVHLKQGDKVIW